MTQVLIIYATNDGHTKTAAEHVAKGVEAAGATAVIRSATDATGDDVLAADAVICGSPVHMGSMHADMKAFISNQCGGLWMGDKAVGKVGAVFATGSGYGSAGGGCELAMLSMLSNLAELGMVLASLPKNTEGYAHGGLHWGPYARVHNVDLSPSEASDEALTVMRKHGEQVAKLAAKLAD